MQEKTATVNTEVGLQSLRVQVTPTESHRLLTNHASFADSVALAVIAALTASGTEVLESNAFSTFGQDLVGLTSLVRLGCGGTGGRKDCRDTQCCRDRL